MSELTISELSYRPNKYTKEILKQITTEIRAEGFYGILGPNGSGKTTLIRHILSLITAQQGTISLDGEVLKQMEHKRVAKTLSFVPQNTFLEADFSVYDIVAMGRTPYQTRFSTLSRQEEALIEEALELTNTSRFRDKRFNELSGGEAQMVLIARAIAQDTPWIILDEPISHLDIKHQFILMELLRYLNKEKKKTIVSILHDINLASQYCDHLILMKQGSIYKAGDTKEVLTRENLKEVYELEFQILEVGENKESYFIPGGNLEVSKEEDE